MLDPWLHTHAILLGLSHRAKKPIHKVHAFSGLRARVCFLLRMRNSKFLAACCNMAVQAEQHQQPALQEDEEQCGPQPVTKLEVTASLKPCPRAQIEPLPRYTCTLSLDMSDIYYTYIDHAEPWNLCQRCQEAGRGWLPHGGIHCLCTKEGTRRDQGNQRGKSRQDPDRGG